MTVFTGISRSKDVIKATSSKNEAEIESKGEKVRSKEKSERKQTKSTESPGLL